MSETELQQQIDTLQREIAALAAENARLERDSRFLQTLMDSVPDHIYFKDSQSRFLKINKSMAEWFSISTPEKAVGKTDADFFSSEHAQQALADEQRIMRTGEPIVAQEEKETWTTGGQTWVSSTKVPMRDRDGRAVGICGISRDITRHKRVQQERERFLKELQDALDRIKTLHGLIPICSECKRVRNDRGYWQQVEAYVSDHSDATFSHGLCEECAQQAQARYAAGVTPDGPANT